MDGIKVFIDQEILYKMTTYSVIIESVIHLKKIDTLLFDLDGTLVDSNECILETFHRTLKKYFPEKNYTRQDYIEMMGPPLYETFQKVAQSKTLIQEMIDEYRRIYVEIEFDYVKVYPHVLETLRYFKEAGFHIGIVTTKFKVSALPSIREFKIDQYLDVLIALDDVINHKPHPEPVMKALSHFSHQEAIMIGDNSTDLLAGKNAGILTCGVEWSMKKAELTAVMPDFWMMDFSDLIQIVNTYNREA